MSLSGKNVIFVGGLGAIGYEACKSLMSRDPASFFVFDMIENTSAVEALQALNAKTEVHYTKFDITDKSAVQKSIADVVAKVKYIDVLVNGAGILAESKIEMTVNVNLIGLINTVFEALPHMDKTRSGRGGLIVNVASVLGLEPCPPFSVYTGTKFGVMGFSRSLAEPYYYELTGVAVMIFCPGLTETPLKNSGDGATFEYSKELQRKFATAKSQTPAECGAHLAEVIDVNQNGGIYISDLGTLRQVQPTVYWSPIFT